MIRESINSGSSNSVAVIAGGRFEDNISGGSGGAVSGAFLDISRSEFVRNVAATNGGAIFGAFFGLRLGSGPPWVALSDSTFVGNGAATGGAVYTEFGNPAPFATVLVVKNGTFSANRAVEGGALYSADIVAPHRLLDLRRQRRRQGQRLHRAVGQRGVLDRPVRPDATDLLKRASSLVTGAGS